MTPTKKKLLKAKEVSLDSSLKEETPMVELPNDENKLFDVDDDVGNEGKCLRKWVKHLDMENMEQFFKWNENWITIGELHTSYLENSWDKGNLEFLKTNSIQNLHMIWKYLCRLIREAEESSIPWNPFSILLSDQFCKLTGKNS